MNTIYLGLGTNLGDRLANLRAAQTALAPSVVVRQSSQIYETSPWGLEDQPSFLNMAVKAETDLPPLALLAYLKSLEQELGRIKSVRWGPRLIDIDILFYLNRIIDTPELVIPHPCLRERAFVLVPLADVAPDFVHPTLGKTIRQLLEEVDRSNIISVAE